MKDSLILYTTSGCHLCEQAEEVLLPLLGQFNLQLKLVDIADDDKLIEQFGVRIPVIKRPGSEQDLGWPFDAEAASHYLTQNYEE